MEKYKLLVQQVENQRLKKAIQSLPISSYSAIQPNEDHAQQGNLMPVESILSNEGKNLPQNDNSEEILNQVENLMAELTRLMDNLENQPNGANKNSSYQLSKAANQPNQTQKILGKDDTIGNILNNQSNNNSNVYSQQQQQNMQQGDVTQLFRTPLTPF